MGAARRGPAPVQLALAGRYEPADFLHAHWLALQPEPWMQVLVIVAVVTLGPAAVVSLMLRFGAWGWGDLVLPACLAFWGYVLLVSPWWQVRRHFRRCPQLSQPYVGVISGAGILGWFVPAHGRTSWEAVGAVRYNHRLILLYLDAERYLVLPRRFFVDERDWRAMLRFLRRQFGCCPRCDYELRDAPSVRCPECGAVLL